MWTFSSKQNSIQITRAGSVSLGDDSLLTPEPANTWLPLIAGATALIPATLLAISYVIWWQMARYTPEAFVGTEWLRSATVVLCGFVCPAISIVTGLSLLKSVRLHSAGIFLISCGAALLLFTMALRPG